ncbi:MULTISPECIES: hypothetical protein [Streptacidiphilus]|uniref:Membrane protein YfcA n=1 Tax=Streptacidiphilus cavernicola TaxID=3342716 RepID=A0ABV6V1P6_9ACTN|nr:hypothetical protein [Streptacidiphilus jeojiense]
MSGYSGSPIFPAEGRQPSEWNEAEQTSLLPPYPQGPPDAAAAPPPTSRFGQIHERYATTEVPLPQELIQPQFPSQEQGQGQGQGQTGPGWPSEWERGAAPAAAPAPPTGWQPQQQPGAQQWQQQPGVPPQAQSWPAPDAEATAFLPPVPPQPGAPGWQQPAQGADAFLPPQAQPGAQQWQQPGVPPQAQPWGTPDAEATAFLPPVPPQPQPGAPGWQQPASGGDAEATAFLPPVPPQPQPGTPGWQQLGTPGGDAEATAYLPPVPPAGAAAPPYPVQAARGAEAPAPEYFDALGSQPQSQPLAYGAPTSLRETFAAAQPTGPAGEFAPPPPQPLEAQPGGSLREAFAAAQPTGPTAPEAAAHPQGPAAPAVPAQAARKGSPIVDPGIQPAAATAAIAVLLTLAALLGRPALVVPTLLLQAVTSAGWFRLNGMWPARQGIALAALGGVTADAAMLAASGGTAPAVLAGTLGGFFLLVLILQIFRPSNPDERFYALTVSASATVMTVLAGCFLAAGSVTHHGWSTGAAVTAGALSAAVATAVSALPMLPAKAGFGAGAAAGLLVGALLGAATGLGAGGGLLLGLAAGACALVGRRVAGYDFPSRFVHLTAGVAVPLACAAPAVFLVGHLLAG